MGIALFADLFMPLQSLARRWSRSRRAGTSHLRYVGIKPGCTARAGSLASTDRVASARPLRVVRTIERQQPGCRTGRVVISGRMADVCAELDRLAEIEASGYIAHAGHSA